MTSFTCICGASTQCIFLLHYLATLFLTLCNCSFVSTFLHHLATAEPCQENKLSKGHHMLAVFVVIEQIQQHHWVIIKENMTNNYEKKWNLSVILFCLQMLIVHSMLQCQTLNQILRIVSIVLPMFRIMK